uniref:Uncharacterized protein n=1 Tax=Arundo donax TaxID=35708 RepID=A0A0A9BMC4_ARUDO
MKSTHFCKNQPHYGSDCLDMSGLPTVNILK